MTKEAVRAPAPSKLGLYHTSHLIDISVETGSVSVEAMLQHPELRVTAIERNPAALRLLDENRQYSACAGIDVFPGVIPMTVTEEVDAISMGDSGGHLAELIGWSMRQLHPAGRLVMASILQEDLNTVLTHLDHLDIQGADCLQLQVSSLATLGSDHYLKPSNPILVIACQKKENHV